MKNAARVLLLAATFALPVLAESPRRTLEPERARPEEELVTIRRGELEQRLDALDRLVQQLESPRGGNDRRDGSRAETSHAHDDSRGERRFDREELRALKRALSDLRATVRRAPPTRGNLPPPSRDSLIASSQELELIKQAVTRESFSAERLKVLSSAVVSRHLSVQQVQGLLKVFSFSGDRLKALEVMAPRTIDLREQGFLLFDAFDFSTDKDKARVIIERSA